MNRAVLYALLLSGVLFILGLLLYLWGLGYSVEKARTLVFTFSVFSELAYCFSIRSAERIWQNFKGFFINKFLIITLLISAALQILIFIKPLQEVFKIVPLNLTDVLVLSACTFFAFFLAEIIRYLFDRKAK